MKTFAQLNKYIGKADARLISARDGLQAVRNPNGSVAVKIGDKAIVKFGTNKEVTLNTHGQLTPKLLRVLNTYSPYEIEPAYGQWFIHAKAGYMTRIQPDGGERKPGWRYSDGIAFGPDGQVEPAFRQRLDMYDVPDERARIQNYAKGFVKAMTRAAGVVVLLEHCRCPYCSIIVNKQTTLGEIDPTHLRRHIDYMEFNAPLICRAVEKSAPRHHDEAIVALNKFMKKESAIRLSAAEQKLLSGILRNYLYLEMKHPIYTNGI